MRKGYCLLYERWSTHDKGFQSFTEPEDIIEWARVSRMIDVAKLHDYHDYWRSTTKEPPTTGKTTIWGKDVEGRVDNDRKMFSLKILR